MRVKQDTFYLQSTLYYKEMMCVTFTKRLKHKKPY